jgi:S-adenosylmethionine decarboxylase proenzyme
VKTIGRHLIAELYRCDPQRLADLALVQRSMLEAAGAIGATILGNAFHHFSPSGVSGAVVIAESHLSIHTWPEHGYGAVDVFTCGDMDPRPALLHLKAELGAADMRVQEIVRGLSEEVEAPRGPEDVEVVTRQYRG